MQGIKKAAVFPEPVRVSAISPIAILDCGQTSLSNTNHVMTRDDSRDRVGLDGGRCIVTAEFDVFHEDGMDASIGEL